MKIIVPHGQQGAAFGRQEPALVTSIVELLTDDVCPVRAA